METDPAAQPHELEQPSHDLAELTRRVRTLLRTRLEPHRHYHDLFHTLDDVLPAAERLARAESIAPHERILVRAAALLHDTGYVEGPVDHEFVSVRIAKEWLPELGFSAEEVDRVATLILATRLGSVPATPAERVMADADLDLLGREDFWSRSLALRREWVGDGFAYDDATWARRQVLFLQEHSYKTATARRTRQPGKEPNLRLLQAYLRDLPGNDADR